MMILMDGFALILQENVMIMRMSHVVRGDQMAVKQQHALIPEKVDKTFILT